MNKTNDLDEIANNLVKVVNTGIDRMILWEVDGTDIEELEDDYFNETISDIKYKLIKKLKETL
jgi:hypothetical protein|tara:strand:+ start:1400 stop:1588 length:189 start_codon:yes stop_codon:yes gene_type:complete